MTKYALNTERLAECRNKIGISKIEAAKKIGVSQPAYLRYESGERTPSLQVIKEIAKVFQTSSDYLIGKTDNSEITEYVITKADFPELFVLVERCTKSDREQVLRLLAYLDMCEKQEK